MSVIASIFAALLLTCVGVALALLGSVQSMIAAHDERATAAAYAAQAAVVLSSAQLRTRGDWSGAARGGPLSEVCAVPGGFTDATLLPSAPWGGSTIDLRGLTASRQTDSDSAAPAGLTGPVWCLFEYGPISRLVPSDARRHPFYVAVWTAAGPDGRVLLHASAFGAGSVRASVETSIRPGVAGARRQAIRATP